jgi:hypothetical protein
MSESDIIIDDDLGEFAPGMRPWSRQISLAAPDKRCDVGHWRKIDIVSIDPFVKARLGFDAPDLAEIVDEN